MYSNQGLSLNQVKKCLENIAHFHAVSYCYSVIKDEDFTNLPFVYESYFQDSSMMSVKKRSLELMKTDFQLLSSNKKILEKALNNFAQKDHTFLQSYFSLGHPNFLSHNDYWSNNIMENIHNGGKMSMVQYSHSQ